MDAWFEITFEILSLLVNNKLSFFSNKCYCKNGFRSMKRIIKFDLKLNRIILQKELKKLY